MSENHVFWALPYPAYIDIRGIVSFPQILFFITEQNYYKSEKKKKKSVREERNV